MIRYLIKNNFKLMLRNKWIIAIMILGPILVIATLSSAFSDLMKSYEGVDDFSVGYRVEEGSVFSKGMEAIEEAGKEAGITFLKYQEGEPKEVIESNGLAGFVEFKQNDYTVYESADFEVEGITLEYFLNRVVKMFEDSALQVMIPVEKETIELPVQTLDFLPAIDAVDYYGIIYIVYFSWCGIVCAANVLTSEKKYGINRKFQVTAISDVRMYLAKLIPVILVVTVGMMLSTIITVLLFGIHWGNILIASLLLFLTIIASSALGLMIYYLFQDVAITVIVLFTVVWFMAFFGGSFETYMYSSHSEVIKSLSPIYHINRALVENACMGHSKFTGSCVLYMLAITFGCSVIAIAVQKIRRRGRA
ncbi:MAG TPA: ABC transporter permease [Lachnospiraceae bacterium]|nr:ABC transporter permease [Lachnospiraceae bacterium]